MNYKKLLKNILLSVGTVVTASNAVFSSLPIGRISLFLRSQKSVETLGKTSNSFLTLANTLSIVDKKKEQIV